MRAPFRVFLCGALLAAAALAANAAQAGILITVDKAAQRMSVAVDGTPKYSWPVSTGKAGYATPSGAYTPFRLEADHFSKEWDDAPMPHSIFFTRKGHAIHGSFDTKRLGRAVSHGCVRLAPAHAATLFALVKEQGLNNTKVVIGGAATAPAVARRRAPAAEEELQARAPRDGVTVWGGEDAYVRRVPPRYYGDDRYPRPYYDGGFGARRAPFSSDDWD